MDEESGSNSNAKRSKLDNNTASDQTETSMSTNDNDITMKESSPVPGCSKDAKDGEINQNSEGGVSQEVLSLLETEKGANKSEEDVEDVVDVEEEAAGTSGEAIKKPNRSVKRGRNYRSQLYSSSSDSDYDDDDDDSFDRIVRGRPSGLTRRASDNAVSSPANSDLDIVSSENEMDSSDTSTFTLEHRIGYSDSEESNGSNNDMNVAKDAIICKAKPNYNWSLVHEVMYREHGLNNNLRNYPWKGKSQHAFQEKFYAARHIIEKLEMIHKLEVHRGCVNSLNFNKTGEFLASGSDDLAIIIWKWASKNIAYKFESGHDSSVFQTKFVDLGGGINIVSSARDGQVIHSTIRSTGGKPLSTVLFKHSNPVHKIALAPQNPFEILTAGEDAHVIRCDLRENLIEHAVTVKHRKRKVPLYSIAHHPSEPEFCVCGRDQFVRVYDKRSLKKPMTLMCPQHLEDKKSFNSHVTCAVYNASGSEILASYSEESVYLFNNRCYLPGHFTHQYKGHNNHKTIKGVNFFGLNSEYVVSGSDCGNIFFWDKDSEAIINWVKGDYAGVVNCLEPHPMFPILATSGLDYDVKIWVPSNKEYPPKLEGMEKCIKHNLKRSAMAETDFVDDRTFYFFVRQCLRNRRARQSNSNCPNVEDLISTDSGEEDGCGPEDEFGRPRSLPCTPQ